MGDRRSQGSPRPVYLTTARAAVWRPLLRVSSTTWLGVVEGDEATLWTRDEAGPLRQVELANPRGCLPLLERAYDDVADDLSRIVGDLSSDARSATSCLVPGGIVEAALQIGTDYWLAGACGWLEALAPSEHTTAWALRIEDATGASQSTQHAARRVRRRWSPPRS